MNRRNFLGLLAAPAIIRVADLMPIRAVAKSPLLAAPYGRMQFVDLNIGATHALEEYSARCLKEIVRAYGIPRNLLTGDSIDLRGLFRNRSADTGLLRRIRDS